MSFGGYNLKGNVVVATRAARRAQELVMLIEEQGLSLWEAERRLQIPRRTSSRYRAIWGRSSANLVGRREGC